MEPNVCPDVLLNYWVYAAVHNVNLTLSALRHCVEKAQNGIDLYGFWNVNVNVNLYSA